MILANNVLIQIFTNLMRCWQRVIALHFGKFRELFLNDVSTEVNALITNENRWASNQLLYFVLALTAERAIQNFICAIGGVDIAQDGRLNEK